MTRPSRAIKIFVGLALFFSFLFIAFKAVDPDLGWHIRVGQWILEHRAVPRADIYSNTMPGYAWVDHEWLVNAWFWWMRAHGAWPFVPIAFAALAAIPFAAWVRRADSYEALGLLVLVAIVFMSFFGVRPQMISFVLFFLVFELLARAHGFGGAPPRRNLIFFLPLVFFVWANLHAGFTSGLLLFGAMIGGDALEWVLARRKGVVLDMRPIIDEMLVLAASFAATFLNPYGIDLYREVWRVATSAETMRYISEWQTGLLFPSFALIACLAFFGICVIRFYRGFPLYFFVPTVLFFALFMKAARMGPLFLVLTVPFLEMGFNYAAREIEAAWEKHPPAPQMVRHVKIVGVMSGAVVMGLLIYGLVTYKTIAPPEGGVNFLIGKEQAGAQMTLFNEYQFGGYLLLRDPGLKVFIDGRMPHWVDASGNSAMKDYIRIVRPGKENVWEETLAKRSVNVAFLPAEAPAPQSAIVGYVPNWLKDAIMQSVALRQFANFFGASTDTFSLVRALKGVRWNVAYDDGNSVVLTKPGFQF